MMPIWTFCGNRILNILTKKWTFFYCYVNTIPPEVSQITMKLLVSWLSGFHKATSNSFAKTGFSPKGSIMKVGSGYSTERSSFVAGVNATENALKNGNIIHPDLLIAFCSGKLDINAFLKGIQNVVGTVPPVVGGSAIGIVTNEHLSYDGYSAGVAAFESGSVQYQIASVGNLAKCEKAAGKKLAACFPNPLRESFLIIFYDSLKKPATADMPPVMNASSPLIDGIASGLAADIPVFGAGLLSDFAFLDIPGQFCGAHADTNSVVGLLIDGGIAPYFRIMHGCSPLDGVYHNITRSQGAVIYEIDNQPAVKMIDGFYGNKQWRSKRPVDLLTIGVNCGQKFAPPNESNYVNRLITGVLPDESGIGIFESDLEAGTEIQFMLRDNAKMVESAARNCDDLMRQIIREGRTARFGLYIDCAGRTSELSNTMTEEAEEVQKVLNHYQVPLLGMYSGVEIAPFLDKSRGLDWTGVLIVFTE